MELNKKQNKPINNTAPDVEDQKNIWIKFTVQA
jgi:hypothetical protein